MLSVILGHSELALELINPESEIHQSLREIQTAAQRSAELTRQLLSFARKQSIRPKVLDLNETIAGMLKILKRLIGENIELSWSPGQNLWPAKMDPSQLDQILANLVVNARDAISGAGRVLLETSNLTLDETCIADHSEIAPGDYVQVLVSDTGSGMSREIRDRLFEPYFTTKEMGRGTGLGLATVYGIVKQNHGFIYVSSEEHQGTSIKIYIPRFEGPIAKASGKRSAEEVSGGTETILLVEDEEAILSLTKKRLESLGYKVLAARAPGEAIDQAKAYQGKIHLLIADIVLPEMNGLELAEQLKDIQPKMKCLYMSGYSANVISPQEVLRAGIQLIPKPFSMKTLAEKIREMLSRR